MIVTQRYRQIGSFTMAIIKRSKVLQKNFKSMHVWYG